MSSVDIEDTYAQPSTSQSVIETLTIDLFQEEEAEVATQMPFSESELAQVTEDTRPQLAYRKVKRTLPTRQPKRKQKLETEPCVNAKPTTVYVEEAAFHKEAKMFLLNLAMTTDDLPQWIQFTTMWRTKNLPDLQVLEDIGTSLQKLVKFQLRFSCCVIVIVL